MSGEAGDTAQHLTTHSPARENDPTQSADGTQPGHSGPDHIPKLLALKVYSLCSHKGVLKANLTSLVYMESSVT